MEENKSVKSEDVPLRPVIKKILKNILPVALIRSVHFCRKLVNTWHFQIRDLWIRPHRHTTVPNVSGKVSIIIPTLSKGKQADHLPMLHKLLSRHLPRQTYDNYEAIVYCDGPNPEVEKMVECLNDDRIKVLATETTLAKWGHPQTRLGIMAAMGEYFVRMNDDNVPWPNYLETLVGGFDQDVGVVYGRIIFKGDARRAHSRALMRSFVLPGDKDGTLEHMNIDYMNYMVRMDLARKNVQHWDDSYASDWVAIDSLLRQKIKAVFRDVLIGEKY